VVDGNNWSRHWGAMHPRVAKKHRTERISGQLPRTPYWAETPRGQERNQVRYDHDNLFSRGILSFFRGRGLRLKHKYLEAAEQQWMRRVRPHPY
jgi:hypothetical protein